ncbi:MAG: ATP-binding protein [Planctomycetota bacterium]|jgi:uncharacterized protein YhaN
MRIRQLNLIAFGHFTGASIPLNQGTTGVDVIYGPNEAGKSTTLRAVQCLLFGFPKRTTDSFLHTNPKLRVGATLGLRDGSTMSVVRRKGNVKTLRDQHDDGVVDDAQLAALLGPLESESFRSRFALDSEELASGGQALVSGHGDLAQALFAAASGGRQLDQLRDRLEERSAELFKERASKPVINVGLKQVGDLDRQIRDASLAPAEWTQTREELDGLEQRREEITSELSELDASIRQRERFRDALPSIAKRREAMADLERLRDVPLLSDDFSERRSSALAAQQNLQQQIERDETDLEKRRAGFAGLDVSDELLRHAATIRELRDDVRRIRDVRSSFGDRARQIEQLRKTATACLRELRRPESDEIPESMRPSASVSRRLDQLRGEYQTLQEKQRSLADRDAHQRAALAQSQKKLAASPPVADFTVLRRAVEHARQSGPLESQRDDARAEQQQANAKLDSELAGLTLWSGTVDELERLAVPLNETLERFDQEFSEVEDAIAELRREAARLDKEIASAEAKLNRLTSDRKVPTEQSLTAARKLRDRAWQLVVQRLSGAAKSESDNLTSEEIAIVAEVSSDGDASTSDDLVDAYEQAVRDADEIGDRLRHEAQLVAEALTLRGALGDLQRSRETVAAATAKFEQQLAGLTTSWQEQWTPLSIEPLSPREMKEWTRRRLGLLERAATARLVATKIEQCDQQIEQQCEQLMSALRGSSASGDVGSKEAGFRPSLTDLVQRAERELAARLDTQNARSRLQEAVDKEQAALQKLDRERTATERELADWQAQWQSVVEELGTGAEFTPGEAAERLRLVTDWFAAQDQIDALNVDDQKAREQSDAFDRRATALLERLASDLLPKSGQTDTDLTAAIEELDSRREANQKLAVKHGEAQNELNSRETALDDARRKLTATSSKLKVLCDEARVESVGLLTKAEEQSRTKRRVEERLAEASELLAGFSGGRSLDEFAEAAAAFTLEQLDAEIGDRTTRRTELQTELNELLGRRGELTEKLSGWTGESLAAQANEERESVLAELRSTAEEYARLAIVSELLKQTGERYREKHQGPVLGRASKLFRELTCGAFSGIQTDYDDKGTPIIVGVRSGGADSEADGGSDCVDVSGMSEGTCDQLYLALRLASLDEYLSQHEAVPLLIDDLLIRFDDARSAAALRVLAEVSQHTQIIVFTHHEHVVDLAQKTIDAGLLHVHRLEPRA